MIAIIDYDAGNIRSVENALLLLGEKPCITRDRETLLQADKVILPGVGAFGSAMEKIRTYGLDKTIYEIVQNGTPFMGICLGLQLLFEESEETPAVKGLGLLEGKIVKIPDQNGQLKIPHMGWNSLQFNKDCKIFRGLAEDSYVYFVHSYYLKAKNPEDVIARTEYGEILDVAVQRENIYACQFHPEKSSSVGLKILENFIRL